MRRFTTLVRAIAVAALSLTVGAWAVAGPTIAPPAPTGVTATASALGVAVGWDPVGESAATVSRSRDGGASWQDVATVSVDPASSERRAYDDRFALVPGAGAAYRITALGAGPPPVAGPPSDSAVATAPRESIIAEGADQSLESRPVGGGDAVGLLADPGHRTVAVSPDGRQVATAWQSKSASQVVRYTLTGGSGPDVEILYSSDLPVSGLTWSPDGATLAWNVTAQGISPGATQLVLGSPTGADTRTVDAAAGLSATGWLPDSQTLLMVAHDSEVFLVDVLADTATDLGLRGTPRITADGRLLVLGQSDGTYAAYAFDPSSRAVGGMVGRSVTQGLQPTKAFDLSSDGTALLTAAAGTAGLLRAPVDASAGVGLLSPVTTTEGEDPGVWQGYRPVLTPTGPAGSGEVSGFAITPGAMDPATTFTCALDGAAASSCPTWTTPTLAVGRHTLVVTGTEPGTLRHAVSARTWSVGLATYTPVPARRVLDTRSGIGAPKAPLGPSGSPSGTVVLTVPGLPAGTTAVTLNLTAEGATTGTYLTAYPTGGTLPETSSLNVPTPAAIANLVTVKVAPGGRVSIANRAGAVNVIADLQGWFAPASGYRYTSVTPARIVDTRTGRGGLLGPIAGVGLTDPVGWITPGGIDLTDARALSLNVTVASPTRPGWLTAYDGDAEVPATSNLNFAARQDVANLVTMAADGTSRLAFLTGGSGSVQVVADLAGYYGARGTAFTALTPQRIVDTRDGTGAPRARLGVGQSVTIRVPGLPRGATAVAVNVTAVGPTAAGYLVAYPAGVPRPGSSTVNFPAGRTVANAAVVAVDAQGAMVVSNATGTTDVLIDLAGYYAF